MFLSGSLQSGLSVKRGEEIHLTAFISGFPYPEITWMRNNSTIRPEALKKRPEKPIKKKKEKKAEEEKIEEDKDKKEEKSKELQEKKEEEKTKEEQEKKEEKKEKEIEPEEPEEPEEEYHPSLNERLTIDNSRKGESSIVVKDVIRGDHGVFTIKVENDHGIASATCEVNVLGKLHSCDFYAVFPFNYIGLFYFYLCIGVQIHWVFISIFQILLDLQSTSNLRRSERILSFASGNLL